MTATKTAIEIHCLSCWCESLGDRRQTKTALDNVFEAAVFNGEAVHLAIANKIPATPLGIQIRRTLIENVPESRAAFESYMLDVLYHLEAKCGWPGMYCDDFNESEVDQ